jgi:dipeptidyl aminopeptidase/acylaminoacyl peptidase
MRVFLKSLLPILFVPTTFGASFSLDQIMSAPFASNLIAAPKGAAVAWLVNDQGRRNVWLASAPDWKARKITAFDQDDGQDVDDLAWAPEASYILFARGGDFENGEDNPNPALSPSKPQQAIWIAPLDGSQSRKLTDGHAPAVSPNGGLVAFIRGGQIFTMTATGANVVTAVAEKWPMKDLRWSPDGAHLAFVSDRRDHSLIGIYTPTEKRLEYLDASVDRDMSPVWSPDGARIAYVRIPVRSREEAFGPHREGEPWSIRVTDLGTGTVREIFRAENGPGSVFHAIAAPDQIFWSAGSRIVFPWERSGWCHLYSVPAQGEGAAVELTPGEGEVEHVAISTDRNAIYYSANFGDIDRRHLWSVNLTGAPRPKLVTRGEDIEWQPAPLADGSAVALLATSYNQAAHAAVRTTDGAVKALAPETVPSDFPASSLVRPEPVKITAADGLEIHGQLFLPAGGSGGTRHPALIFFHGGSRRQMLLGFHYMYYYSNAYSLNQFLANHGYVVLSVNYRSGIGYGLNFREAIDYGMKGASEFNDVIGAGLYLKARKDVDPHRIGVWGGSYGGYLTAMALARASDLFAAGVDFHGVHDWSELEPASGPPSDPSVAVAAAKLAFDSSPMASVATWKSPVLLIHGDDDRNVAFSQTVELVEALRKQHVDFEELIIANEIHDFLEHRHWVEAYKATVDFFGRKLRNGEGTARGQ